MITVANLELTCKLQRDFGEHFRLQFREVTQKARHAAGSMMFGQPIGGQHKWKSRITRRRKPIVWTREPMLRRIGVARIKFIRYGRLKRFVMRRERAVLQAFWHVDPAQAVLVQDKRRITWNCIETFSAYLWLIVRSFSLYKAGNVDTGPFFRVPPHKFFPFAPWTAVRPRTGAIVNDSTIARPREAPAVTEVISRFPCVCLVYAIATEHAGVNPSAACSGSVSFQFRETVHLRAVMRIAIAIYTENDALAPTALSARGYRLRVPAVDLGEHSFHLRLAQFVLRIPPIERAQRFIERIV